MKYGPGVVDDSDSADGLEFGQKWEDGTEDSFDSFGQSGSDHGGDNIS